MGNDDFSNSFNEFQNIEFDWVLSECCNSAQTAFAVLFFGYFILVWFFIRTIFMKPMRLIATFIHEMSHATACWMTGGRVTRIRVFENEGGVTHFIGGCRCMIIPAGYIGCAFWAMIFVIMSGNRVAATIAASVFSCSLFVALFFSPNKTMVILCLGYLIVTAAFIYIEWFYYSPILQFLTLFYGVSIGLSSVTDIRNDLVVRTVRGSDAYACYELIPCCFPKCIGLIWGAIAVSFQCLGFYIGLVWNGTKDGDIIFQLY